MTTDVAYKPNPEKLKEILAGYPPHRVKFILDFVSAMISRLKDGTLYDYNVAKIADDLGILSEVDAIIHAFDVPEDEFWRRYGDDTRQIAATFAADLKEVYMSSEGKIEQELVEETEKLAKDGVAEKITQEMLDAPFFAALKESLKRDAECHRAKGTLKLPVDPEEFATRLESSPLMKAVALKHEDYVRAIKEVCDELGIERAQ